MQCNAINNDQRQIRLLLIFFARIDRYLEAWLTLNEVEKTYGKLLHFILRDQFMDICNRELHQKYSNKKLISAPDVAENADLFAKTRGDPKHERNM